MTHIRFILIALSLMLLSACATPAGKADTRHWTTLTCSGFLQWKDCWDQARAICPEGFDIANQIEMRGQQKREVEIACKAGR
ncbi:MAG TPA: hypothetical protein VN063_06015 [Methylophilaceae bacterium]|nr:hypothetical protein [Methylophilaceae bacterium]